MARKKSAPRKRRTKFEEPIEEQGTKSDLIALGRHAQENPLIYAAAAALVVVGVVAGILFRLQADASTRDDVTRYARAMENTDAALRAAELEQIAGTTGDIAAEVLYMWGEAAAEAQDFEKAKTAYERLRAEHPNSPFTPDGVEGIGFAAEATGDSATAVATYREVLSLWPEGFTARRQQFNIGRSEEAAGNVEAAVTAYREQLTAFPNSTVAQDAQLALNRLRASNPEAFPAVPIEAAAESTAPAAESAEVVLAPDTEDADAEADAAEAEATEEAPAS
jgi:tetratricopeptide (TPR) repeat protein